MPTHITCPKCKCETLRVGLAETECYNSKSKFTGRRHFSCVNSDSGCDLDVFMLLQN